MRKWKPILQYKKQTGITYNFPEGKYYISDDGMVYSTDKYDYISIKKDKNNSYGYVRYILYDENGNKVKTKGHILVAQNFIRNPKNKTEVDHIDHDKFNNVVSNLRWVTHQENLKNRRNKNASEN